MPAPKRLKHPKFFEACRVAQPGHRIAPRSRAHGDAGKHARLCSGAAISNVGVGKETYRLITASAKAAVLHYPAYLLCLFISGNPGKGKKLWKADLACLDLSLRRGKGIGDELIVARFFIDDVEARARHRDDDVSIPCFHAEMGFAGHEAAGSLYAL